MPSGFIRVYVCRSLNGEINPLSKKIDSPVTIPEDSPIPVLSGLLSLCSSDLQVIRFNLKYLANLQNVQLYLERRLISSSRSMAMAAVQICVITAFSVVPTNDLMTRFCFMRLKNNSICQRSLYKSVTSGAVNSLLLVRNSN